MKALATGLITLEDVLNDYKTDLQQQHSKGSIECQFSSGKLSCIQQSEASMKLGDGDSIALVEAKFLSPKKLPGHVSSHVGWGQMDWKALQLGLIKMQDYYVPIVLKDKDYGVANNNGTSPSSLVEGAQDC